MTPDVRLDVTDRVATVTIDRPHARNAIGLSTIDELRAVLNELVSDDVNVVVLRGAGERAFVSGGDLKELAAIRDEQGASEMATNMRRLLDLIAEFPLPVVAALNGHALGGGAEVAVAADIRIASADVRIGFTQVALGIMPAWGGAERLVEIVGRSKALLLIGLGKQLSAQEAEQIGLVDLVAPRAEFEDAVRELARGFAELPPAASSSIKSVVAAARPHVHRHAEASAVTRFAQLWVSDYHWRAADELAHKRKPSPVPAQDTPN